MPADWWAPLKALRQPDLKTPWLPGMLARNKDTAYLTAHGQPGTVEEFRSRVPLTSYEDLRRWLVRIEDGEADVLFAGRPVAFERTVGSSGGPKLIPVTREALVDVQRAVLPWLTALADRHTITGRAYLAISPATRRVERVDGIPVGVSDLEYLGPIAGTVVSRATAVPFSVGAIPDVETWRSQTVTHLAAASDLEIISVWSPTFLLQLLDALARRGHRPSAIWPRLKVVSCWASAASRPFADELAARLPGVHLQPKGLLSTEAIVTVPNPDDRPVLTPHGFFEFERNGSVLATDDLIEGETYDVIVTTAGGLYRYRTGDLVRCDGWTDPEGARPILEFVGRSDLTSDLVGEKLTDVFVASCLEHIPGFRLLVPDSRIPCYVLVTDGRADVDPDEIDLRLRRNPQYAYARTLNQLSPLRVRRVPDLFDRFVTLHMGRGVRLADVKPVSLARDPDWAPILGGDA